MPEWAYDFIDFNEVADLLIDYSFYQAQDLGEDLYSLMAENRDYIIDAIKADLDREIVFLWISTDAGKGMLLGTLMFMIMDRIDRERADKEEKSNGQNS